MTSTPPLDPSGQHRSRRSLKSRTSLVTAAAVAGVLIAGTAAVAANIGILNSADSSAIGDLAATDELLPAADTGADTSTTVLETTTVPTTTVTTPTTTPDAPRPQQYDIENTGTVWVMTTTSGLALDHVVAETGWSPVLTQSDLRSLQVDFVNGDRTIVFTAALADDGSVIVDVTEPTTVIAAAPANTGAQSTGGVAPAPPAATYSDDDHDEYEYEDDHDEYEDDEYEDDEYEDDEYEDDEYEDDEYEDDHDEYEGADDDD